jgi:hypothetical protein
MMLVRKSEYDCDAVSKFLHKIAKYKLGYLHKMHKVISKAGLSQFCSLRWTVRTIGKNKKVNNRKERISV